MGFLKCNCDAAMFEHDGFTSMGCVLWNSAGQFMGCFASKHGVLLVREAEVYGLREAITWVLGLNLSFVVFELDAKTVIDSFHSSTYDDSEFGSVI